jgi:hypothetical protein
MPYLILILLGISQALCQIQDWRTVKDYNSKHPCYKDLVLFCNRQPAPTVKNNYSCLSAVMSQLTKECHTFVVKGLDHLPCTRDIQTYCPGPKQNSGQFYKCLVTRLDVLSNKCSKVIGEMKADDDKRTKACGEDEKKLCGKFLDDKRGLNVCMREQNAKKTTSKACQEYVSNRFRGRS